jgi:hypothetical protein
MFVFKQRPGLTWSLEELMIELGNLDRFPPHQEIEAAIADLVTTRQLGTRSKAGTYTTDGSIRVWAFALRSVAMPLTELQFQLKTIDDPVKIIERIQGFLSSHRSLAYTANEVAGELDLDPETALSALYELALLRTIEGRNVKGQLCFRYVRDMTQDELDSFTAA